MKDDHADNENIPFGFWLSRVENGRDHVGGPGNDEDCMSQMRAIEVENIHLDHSGFGPSSCREALARETLMDLWTNHVAVIQYQHSWI